MSARIVSLLPAATDIVAWLGCADRLVGRTHECDWPDSIAAVPVVTGSSLDVDGLSSREISAAVRGEREHAGSSIYALHAGAIAQLEPDLVLTQELCDVCAVSYERVDEAVRLLDLDCRVVSLEPTTIGQILTAVEAVGALLGVPERAAAEVAALRARLSAVADAVRGRRRPTVGVVEWLDPLWPAGHWVPEQVALAGGEPVLAAAGEHTHAVDWERWREADPEVLLLAPCGFPPSRTRAELPAVVAGLPGWGDLTAVRTGRVWILDGPSCWNRPGPRVVRGAEVIARVLHGVEVGEALRPSEAAPAS